MCINLTINCSGNFLSIDIPRIKTLQNIQWGMVNGSDILTVKQLHTLDCSCKTREHGHASRNMHSMCLHRYVTSYLSNEKLTTQATKTVIWEHEGQMEHLVIQLNVIERYTQQH